MTPTGPGATVEQVLAAAPPVRREPGARERIRAMNVAAGRRIAVLDDDPTGSQTVHDVSVVTVFEAAEYAAGLAHVGDTCFILTNTRSLPEAAAVELTTAVAGDLLTLDLGGPVEIISRSDWTLRGQCWPRSMPSTPSGNAWWAVRSTGSLNNVTTEIY